MESTPRPGSRLPDMVYHLTSESEWTPVTGEPHEPASFADEGFVHTSSWRQLPSVAKRHFAGENGLVALEIDTTFLAEPPVWEDLYDLGEEYPHLYQPVPVKAVTGVLELRWAGDDRPVFRRRGGTHGTPADSPLWVSLDKPGPADFALLGRLNSQLIEDEGNDVGLDRAALENRMQELIRSGYTPSLLQIGGLTAGYALANRSTSPVHLRQFFIQRGLRRSGIGRKGYAALEKHIGNGNMTVEVLSTNLTAAAFWHSVGFTDHFVGMRKLNDAPR